MLRHYSIMTTDSRYNSEPLTVAQAAIRLQVALKALEVALNPMADRLTKLEAASEQSDALNEDRARLARELDAVTAKQQVLETGSKNWEARETEFAVLAGETMQELDAVIRQVQQALSETRTA